MIKVGKAGPKSNARFQSQHYGLRAPSTVAKALLTNVVIWPYLGIKELDADNVGQWLRDRTDRHNFFVDEKDYPILSYLEGYLKARLGPALEGLPS